MLRRTNRILEDYLPPKCEQIVFWYALSHTCVLCVCVCVCVCERARMCVCVCVVADVRECDSRPSEAQVNLYRFFLGSKQLRQVMQSNTMTSSSLECMR